MKLHEILDAGELAHRLDVLNKDKPKSTHTLIKLLRAKANRRNPKRSKTSKWGSWDPFGGMTGYGGNQGKDFVAPHRDGIA